MFRILIQLAAEPLNVTKVGCHRCLKSSRKHNFNANQNLAISLQFKKFSVAASILKPNAELWRNRNCGQSQCLCVPCNGTMANSFISSSAQLSNTEKGKFLTWPQHILTPFDVNDFSVAIIFYTET